MQPDPLIDEIRAVRSRISAEHGHDPYRLVAYYKQREQELRKAGHRLRTAPFESREENLVLNDRPRPDSHST